jgi:uncharacterized membrane-anchored protein
MEESMRKIILILTTLVALVAVNFNIYQREQLITAGRPVLLALAPVDPRSLMQGEYMALRFEVANQAFRQKDLKTLEDGHLVLSLDEQNRATFSRFAGDSTLADNEVLMRYRIRHGSAKFATNAFFFQEGEANRYTSARFGEFRVARDGEAILIRLRDQELSILGEKQI